MYYIHVRINGGDRKFSTFSGDLPPSALLGHLLCVLRYTCVVYCPTVILVLR